MWRCVFAAGGLLALLGVSYQSVDGMCGYFRPIVIDIKQSPEVLQPSQIAFITYDPDTKVETVTVQPRFEGNAQDFGMVIPTPSQPKLHEMPRDFFRALGVYTRQKNRVFPQSKLMPQIFPGGLDMARAQAVAPMAGGKVDMPPPRPTTVEVVEVGTVGTLDYKIIKAGRPDDLYKWLKDYKYNYGGDEATLDHYVRKNYFFTVMKIDTAQMKRNPGGAYVGDITPTRFSFESDKLVYPLKITQVSVKDTTDAVFYVQAPVKMDLTGENSYEYQWVSMLETVAQNMGPGDMVTANQKFLQAIANKKGDILKRGQELGFHFQLGQAAPAPGKNNRIPASLDWAKKLTSTDIKVLSGDAPYTEKVPDPDDGFSRADLRNPQRAQAVFKIIQHRLAKYQQERPRGYLVRDASKDDLALLALLKGHVQEGQFLTRFRKTFTKGEMNEDLVMEPATVGGVADNSEHEEALRTVIHGGGFRGGRGGLIDLPVPQIAPPAPQVIPLEKQ